MTSNGCTLAAVGDEAPGVPACLIRLLNRFTEIAIVRFVVLSKKIKESWRTRPGTVARQKISVANFELENDSTSAAREGAGTA